MTNSTMSQKKDSTPGQPGTAPGLPPSLDNGKDVDAWVHSDSFKRAEVRAGVPGIASTVYFLLESARIARPEDTETMWASFLQALDHPIYR